MNRVFKKEYKIVITIAILIITSTSKLISFHGTGDDTLFFGGWNGQNYPHMGQKADYLETCNDYLETRKGKVTAQNPIKHLEGFSMGAGMAAHVAAAHLKKDPSIADKIQPKTLLSCSGFTRATEVIPGFPAAIHPIFKLLQCLPFYKAASLLVAKLGIFPGFNFSPYAEHPIESLKYVAKNSTMPIIFAHDLSDTLVPVTHTYRNYLAAVKSRGSTNNIYLLTTTMPKEFTDWHGAGAHNNPIFPGFWGNSSTIYSNSNQRKKSYEKPLISEVVDTIYKRADGVENANPKNIILSDYQPTPQQVKKLLRRDNAEKYAFFMSKIALFSMIAMRFTFVRDTVSSVMKKA